MRADVGNVGVITDMSNAWPTGVSNLGATRNENKPIRLIFVDDDDD